MSENDIFSHLNMQQKKAVTHKTGPLLIVAGAGTGKTTVITQRIVWLIENSLARPDEILALTFTDKAAGEMEERVDRILPIGYLDLWIMTFHAFAERVLKLNAIDIGLPYEFKILNTTQQWMLIRQNMGKFDLDYYQPIGNPTKFIHALLNHFSRCKDENISPSDYIHYTGDLKAGLDSMESSGGNAKNSNKDILEIKRLEEIAKAFHTYQQLLLDNDSLDFGDLINYALKLFRERLNILKHYQNKFKYILVDEFQDTNYAQYQLIKLLAGTMANITVVLDDDQSIYMWRGASYNNALQFKKDYPECEQISLIENYRTAQNILDLTYGFIQLNNPERLEAQDKSGKLSKNLKSNLKEKGEIHHLHLKSETDEIEAVINKIIDIKNNDSQSVWNDFAVLIRTNAMADGFMAGFEIASVPYMYLSARGLYSKPIIMDIIAFLKAIDDYHESRAVFRILNWPIFNLDNNTISGLNYLARKKACSLYSALKKSPFELKFDAASYAQISKILKLIDAGTSLAKEKNASQVLLNFMINSGWEKYLTKNDNKQSRDSLKYINSFYKIIQEFEKNFTDKSVKNFLQQIEMEMEAGDTGALEIDSDDGPEAVKIMTIHSAKGLEFRHVFIVNLVDKRFPTTERHEPISIPDALIKEIVPTGDVHLQEERRLFYVAMTRAKQTLFLTSSLDYGGARKKKMSRFLSEIGFDKTQPQGNTKQAYAIKANQVADVKKSQEEKDKMPAYFSFTQLKAYESCPLQYKYAHVFKVPTIGNARFSFGKTMHSTLQKFMQCLVDSKHARQNDLFSNRAKNELPSLKQLQTMYAKSWIDDWYESEKQKNEYFKKGKQILKTFYARAVSHLPVIKFLEKGFNFKINGHSIKGTIDRIDELSDGTLEIIDYKTGSVKENQEKDQLLIYQIAGKEIFDEKISKLTFYYLNDNQQVSFLGTEKELAKQIRKISEIIDGIESRNFEPKQSKFVCEYCDFKYICDHRIL